MRRGEAESWVLIVEMEEKKDKEELLDRWWEVRGIVLDDLTLEERKARWRLVEKARMEKAKEKRVEVANRELWIEGKEWEWDENGQTWKEKVRDRKEGKGK